VFPVLPLTRKLLLAFSRTRPVTAKTYVLGKSTDSLFAIPRESPESAIKAQHNPTDNVLHDEEEYCDKQYNANKSANESNNATPVNTIIIAVTAQRVLKEGARDKRVNSRRVHKPGGRENSMNIVAGPEDLRYTPTIVAA
jgi:hypothetical protein